MKKFDLDKFKQIIPVGNTPSEYDTKWLQRANKYIFFLLKIPGIQMVAVGNSVAMNYSNKESDIDLFIVTESNRMRFVRIICTILFQIFKLRKKGNRHSGKFCLSFFATENALDFKSFLVPDDVYMYFWMLYLKPIFNVGNTYDEFIKLNRFNFDFCPYKQILDESKSHIKYQVAYKKSAKFWGKIDKLFKFLFEKRTLNSYEKLGKPYGVVITDDVLKFHDKDKRREISQKYKELT